MNRFQVSGRPPVRRRKSSTSPRDSLLEIDLHSQLDHPVGR
jgi:hypothetical protein